MNDTILLGAVCYQEYSKGYSDFLELAAELELSWVEFKFELPLCSHKNSKIYSVIRKRAEKFGIGLSMHTAFDGLNIASLDRDERIRSIETVKKSLEAASQMEISHATLHGGFLTSADYSAENWNDSKNNNIESIKHLVDYAGHLGLTLCLENGNTFKKSSLKHGVHPGDLKNIRDNVGDDLNFTIDFGHALYFGNDPSFLVSELGADLVKLSHLHSNCGLEDSHRPLGSGVLELGTLLKRSIKEKWSFPLSIEMKSEEDLRHSIGIVRQILAE
jgi:sugar phosphate isomerase/epimerase